MIALSLCLQLAPTGSTIVCTAVGGEASLLMRPGPTTVCTPLGWPYRGGLGMEDPHIPYVFVIYTPSKELL